MELLDETRDLVIRAGGIFNGIWDTPSGRFATVTDPSTLGTALTPVAGLSVLSIQAALVAMRRRFRGES
jgi:hypothetical protein